MRSLYLLFGDPVGHSLSPAIMSRAFSRLRIDAVYAPCHTRPPELAAAIAGLRLLGVGGCNVTLPHKEAMVKLCDRVAPEAARIGAVNCLMREGTTLVGHNTDAPGLLRALHAKTIDPRGRRAVVIGAGGSGRAATWALSRAGADVTVLNRTADKARALAAEFSSDGHIVAAAPFSATERLREAELVVQCTSVGLGSDALAFDPALLSERCVLVDLVYSPTGATAQLRRHRGPGIDGVDVLVQQAIASLEIWLQRRDLGDLAADLRQAALAG